MPVELFLKKTASIFGGHGFDAFEMMTVKDGKSVTSAGK
jgi:hypothetical protein